MMVLAFPWFSAWIEQRRQRREKAAAVKAINAELARLIEQRKRAVARHQSVRDIDERTGALIVRKLQWEMGK